MRPISRSPSPGSLAYAALPYPAFPRQRNPWHRARDPSRLKAPFLKSIRLLPERVRDPAIHPFNVPALNTSDFQIDFTHPVTILVGPNGSGKSTIIEANAALCDFALLGGNRKHAIGDQEPNPLADALRPSWLPKITTGLFTRADGFAGFIAQIDELARYDPRCLDMFDGRSGTERSHGEGYLEIFRNRISGRGIYIFDEPEAALSPARQMEFLRIMRAAADRGDAQFVIATHAPLLMAYAGSNGPASDAAGDHRAGVSADRPFHRHPGILSRSRRVHGDAVRRLRRPCPVRGAAICRVDQTVAISGGALAACANVVRQSARPAVPLKVCAPGKPQVRTPNGA
ncbi:AAA family ATPase [Tanticharoenia sakaeratensis]|uniref:AAA family ATPase n=1 Tax=Tanticharoenia sakaeratensis TaxID=444053 RepID=UPI000AE01536|nr:AAA family ATPase [Tanticharoenia sakaeratensis]GBQ22875.1 hypothetical protein AA103193_2216 [Tanticharoenia sakaeratensis NBRC 103193]